MSKENHAEIRILLPKDKFDDTHLPELQRMSEVKYVLPELLEWLQDMNWPIASKLTPILLNYPKELQAPVKAILKSNDAIWKYSILTRLIKNLAPIEQAAYQSELLQLIQAPTQDEILEEVNLVAKDLLLTLKKTLSQVYELL